MSARDFDRVRKMIHARAGIALNETKRNMVYSRLAKRVRERDLTSFSDYLDLLENDDGGEWQDFVNALTTNQARRSGPARASYKSLTRMPMRSPTCASAKPTIHLMISIFNSSKSALAAMNAIEEEMEEMGSGSILMIQPAN